MRPSFVLYTNYKEKFKRLSDAQMGKLLRAIFEYQETGVVPGIEDAAISMAFDVVKFDLDRDGAKYEEKVAQNRKNASKGGQAKAENRKRTLANASESRQKLANASERKRIVHDNDNDNDDVDDYDCVSDLGGDSVSGFSGETESVSDDVVVSVEKKSDNNLTAADFERELSREEKDTTFQKALSGLEREGIMLSSSAMQEVDALLEKGMEPEVFGFAACLAKDQGAAVWNYARAPLFKWASDGVFTLERAKQENAAFNAKKARRKREQAAKAAGTRPADYYDPADYASDLTFEEVLMHGKEVK